ncbi:hypothetical protein BGW42_006462 [Actinomortierella wolfii]|nr:hypothetical protein BGW42_006462 [Actinomortierella wolfii]
MYCLQSSIATSIPLKSVQDHDIRTKLLGVLKADSEHHVARAVGPKDARVSRNDRLGQDARLRHCINNQQRAKAW